MTAICRPAVAAAGLQPELLFRVKGSNVARPLVARPHLGDGRPRTCSGGFLLDRFNHIRLPWVGAARRAPPSILRYIILIRQFCGCLNIEPYVELNSWQVAHIKGALEEDESGVPGVPHEEVLSWMESWGTDRELSPPKPKGS